MLKLILTLLWVFFTLFSVFGGPGLDEIFPVFDNDIKATIILVINFYLSNTIAYLLGKWSTLGYLNLGLGLVGTIIILFGIEVFATYYVFDEFFVKEWGFWSMSIFVFTLIIVLFYGGIRQVLILFVNTITNATSDTVTGFQNDFSQSNHVGTNTQVKNKTKDKNDLDITIHDLGLPEHVINNMSEVEKEVAILKELLKRL